MRFMIMCCVTMWCSFWCSVVSADLDPVDPPPPPLVTSMGWFEWYDALLAARLSYVTFERDATRYVSSSTGDDNADGLTAHSAWRTLERAREWVSSANPQDDTREVLFLRGDMWRVDSGITTNAVGVRFADYGEPEAERPYFTGFTGVVEPNDENWNPTGDGAYWRVEFTPVSWVREDGDADLDSPLRRVFSVSAVISEPGAWHWNSESNRLYVHPRDGDDPTINGKLYEIAYATTRGFAVGGDGALIENIRADGFGLDPFDSSTLREAFQTRVRDDEQAVVRNCVSYYGSSHIMAHFAGASPHKGGIATFTECVAGFTKINAAGETVFNTFAGQGECQTIFDRCTVARGTLPSSEFAGRRADPVFGHTGGAPATLGLTIVRDMRVLDHPNGARRTGRFNNAPDAKELEDVRVFIVGTEVEGGAGTGDRLCPLFPEGVAIVNSHYSLTPEDLGSDSRLQSIPVDGWWINSTLILDLSEQSSLTFDLYRPSGSDNRARCRNSAIVVRNIPAGGAFRLDGGGASSSPNAKFVNSVFARGGTEGVFDINVPNTPENVLGNAYWQVDPPSADTKGVVLEVPENVTTAPEPGSPLIAGGITLPGIEMLEFDQRERPRIHMAPTIGPLEAAALPADLNNDGSVNGADLAILLASWGDSGGAGDINGDGAVDGADLASMLATWSP